ncbi:MAG: acyl-ACP--UDP-N-acetylglucosamine O-acyltransferase [Burkholderiales bacterium]|jgi:UDP-N-acetylglucosamine acyltransferase|nr:acyl-ACP--UDP-N-acetylglucosamine O-acyltransferase [Burkholderiales bacterium]
MPDIHPTAQVDVRAELASDVEVGAFSVIGPHVVIDSGTKIAPHVVLTGRTRIGKNNRIFQFASIGDISQDKKYHGEDVTTTIGDGNTIRECVTINAGTVQDRGDTRIGDDNWILAYTHIAHDCVVGNHTVFSNVAQLAGHVHIGDYATMGGMCAIHQFCRIGAHAMIGGGTMVLQDVPPYVTVFGHLAKPSGINSEGLRRRGFSKEAILAIKRAYKTLYRNGLTLAEARAQIAAEADTESVLQILLEFISAEGRGIVR